MDKSHIHPIIKILKKELHVGEMPIVSHLAESERSLCYFDFHTAELKNKR